MRPYYSASGIHLYHGDNASLPEALAVHGLKVSDVALLWGDPPYGMRAVERRHGYRKGERKLTAWAPISGDAAPFEPAAWLVWPAIVLWGANYYADKLPASSSWWAWDKKCQPWECDQADGELAWTNLGGPPRFFRKQWLGGTDTDTSKRQHPTQKPVALAEWGFRQAKLKAGDWVVSPWLGSGPEARAALDMGLNFIGFELVEEYLLACVGRLRQQNLFTLGGAA